MCCLTFLILPILFSLVLSDSNISCEKGQEDDCSQCYTLLVSQVTERDQNQFHIQNVFFPPNKTTPSFVTVYYHYEDENSTMLSNKTDVWFWSSSTFYLFHPLHVFQFTSLFFSDFNLRSSEIHLNLSSDCYLASEDHMRLFTQRLKLYATEKSISSPISDSYNPKAENVETLKRWHSERAGYSIYISINFIAFPIITNIFLLFVVYYFNNFAPKHRMEKIEKALNGNDEIKKNNYKWMLQNELILSLTFVLYVLCLSSSAVQFTFKTEEHLNKEVAKYFSFTTDNDYLGFSASISIITFTLDMVVCTIMIGTAFALILGSVFHNKKKLIGVFILLALFTSMVVMLIITVAVKPEKILKGVFYTFAGILVAATVIIVGFLSFCISCTYLTRLAPTSPRLEIETAPLWKFCAYSILFPLCCVANHLNYIIIAFIHDLYHATSVVIVYGIVVIFLFGMLKQLSYFDILKKRSLILQLIIKITITLGLCSYIIIDILLYFFLPINNVFDDAANHFISIYQTTIVLFTALYAYIVINKPHRSPISIFTKAEYENKKSKPNHSWHTKSDDERDIEMATEILMLLRECKKSLCNRNEERNEE